MNSLFVDTGFYLALLSPRDVWHTRAVELSHQIHQPLVLTDLILVDLGLREVLGADHHFEQAGFTVLLK